jgi:histidinol-phosphate aminotransferase
LVGRGSIVITNPNAPTGGFALPRAEIARLLEDHPDIPVVIDDL